VLLLLRKYARGRSVSLQRENVYTVAQLLLQFFAQMRNPLLTVELYGCYMSAASMPVPLLGLRKTVRELLPEGNRSMLRQLLSLLQLLAQNQERSKTSAYQLAELFAPLLLRPAVSSASASSSSYTPSPSSSGGSAVAVSRSDPSAYTTETHTVVQVMIEQQVQLFQAADPSAALLQAQTASAVASPRNVVDALRQHGESGGVVAAPLGSEFRESYRRASSNILILLEQQRREEVVEQQREYSQAEQDDEEEEGTEEEQDGDEEHSDEEADVVAGESDELESAQPRAVQRSKSFDVSDSDAQTVEGASLSSQDLLTQLEIIDQIKDAEKRMKRGKKVRPNMQSMMITSTKKKGRWREMRCMVV
jgi:RhoGAP domain